MTRFAQKKLSVEKQRYYHILVEISDNERNHFGVCNCIMYYIFVILQNYLRLEFRDENVSVRGQ